MIKTYDGLSDFKKRIPADAPCHQGIYNCLCNYYFSCGKFWNRSVITPYYV